MSPADHEPGEDPVQRRVCELQFARLSRQLTKGEVRELVELVCLQNIRGRRPLMRQSAAKLLSELYGITGKDAKKDKAPEPPPTAVDARAELENAGSKGRRLREE